MKQPTRINKIPAPKAAKDIAQRQKKDNEASRKKLLGSICILLFVSILLIKLTSNIKPLPISPDVVDIQSNNTPESSPQLLAPTKIDASTEVATNPHETSSQVVAGNENPELILNDEAQPSDGFKAGVVNKEQTKTTTTTAVNNSTTTSSVNNNTENQTAKKVAVAAVTTAAIVDDTTNSKQPTAQQNKAVVTVKPVKAKPSNNPEDILNASDNDLLSSALKNKPSKETTDANKNAGKKEYIQLAALSSVDKANSLKQELAAKGVNATVQTIETPKGTLYRLKAGPYTPDVAKTKLQQLNSSGYSGIITTK